jgi:hypothetical protein
VSADGTNFALFYDARVESLVAMRSRMPKRYGNLMDYLTEQVFKPASAANKPAPTRLQEAEKRLFQSIMLADDSETEEEEITGSLVR